MLAIFVYFVLPAILLILGLPIFLVLLVTCLVAVLFVAGVPTEAVQTYLFGGLDNFPLLAVPFFVLAGEIMAQGGIARRVVVWVMSLIGGVRGSLAVTTVAASELFGAMSHTAVGTVAAVGRLVFPALKGGGYGDRFAVSLIASSGAIAVAIPPAARTYYQERIADSPMDWLILGLGTVLFVVQMALCWRALQWRATGFDERPDRWLSNLAQAAEWFPLLGLLGTVGGILQTFAASTGTIHPNDISPAITATGSGLFMALINILPTWIVLIGRELILNLGGGAGSPNANSGGDAP